MLMAGEAFTIKLEFAARPEMTPDVMKRVHAAQVHPGAPALIVAMANLLRRELTAEHFEDLKERAIAEIQAKIEIDSAPFTRIVNASRVAAGLPPLIEAEGDVAAAIEQAVTDERERVRQQIDQMVESRVKVALEAAGYNGNAPTQSSMPVGGMAEPRIPGAPDGSLPAVRGGAGRRGR